MKIGHIAAVLMVSLTGCQASAETYTSPQGVKYVVERVPGVVASTLPQNSDLKMADGDLAKYGESLCTLDVPPNTAPSRCDIFVQSDKAGTLIGYAAIIQDKDGASFRTATDTNPQMNPYGRSCGLSGKLTGSGSDDQSPIDPAHDFQAQSMYSAWEKEPGNWLVSPVSEDSSVDTQGAVGVWYVSRKGDKLRINQERWNYCYRSSDVNMDDVFYRVLTLVRAH